MRLKILLFYHKPSFFLQLFWLYTIQALFNVDWAQNHEHQIKNYIKHYECIITILFGYLKLSLIFWRQSIQSMDAKYLFAFRTSFFYVALSAAIQTRFKSCHSSLAEICPDKIYDFSFSASEASEVSVIKAKWSNFSFSKIYGVNK